MAKAPGKPAGLSVDPLVGQQILGYRVVSKLGQGSFGTVYRGEKVTFVDIIESGRAASVVAIKSIERNRLSSVGQDNLISEISTLKKLSHPNVVRLVDFWWDQTRVYLLTEFCAGGDLATYLYKNGPFDEHVVQKVACQLADALYYLHTLNIAHLDIKPQNILLTSQTDPDVKLADFGFARALKSTTKALVGSLLYMSPEMVCHQVIDKKADLWSLGAVLYECVYAVPLFASATEDELVVKLTSEEPIRLPLTPRTTDSFRDLLFHLLQRSPSERLSIEGLQAHSFITAAKRGGNTAKRAPTSSSKSQSLPVPVQRLVRPETMTTLNAIVSLRPDCIDQIANAIHLAEKAIQAEKRQNWTGSFHLFTESIEILLPIYQQLKQNQSASINLRNNLRSIIDEWLKRGESAKALMESVSVIDSSTKNNFRTKVGTSDSVYTSLPIAYYDDSLVQNFATTPSKNVRQMPPTPSPSPSPKQDQSQLNLSQESTATTPGPNRTRGKVIQKDAKVTEENCSGNEEGYTSSLRNTCYMQ